MITDNDSPIIGDIWEPGLTSSRGRLFYLLGQPGLYTVFKANFPAAFRYIDLEIVVQKMNSSVVMKLL